MDGDEDDNFEEVNLSQEEEDADRLQEMTVEQRMNRLTDE